MDSEYSKVRRVLSLYDRLSTGKIIYLKDELNATGMSDRSFKRDITELRNYLAERAVDGKGKKEVVYDRNRNCYYMTDEKDTLPDYQKIFAVAKILLGSKGLSQTEMNQVMEYLVSLCNDEDKRKEIKKFLADGKFNYQGPKHGKDLIGMIWHLAQAVEYQNRLKIRYRRLDGQQEVDRVLEPVGVIFSEYYFYLLAYIKGVREEKGQQINPTIYRIDRIQDMEVLEEHFKVSYSEKFEEQKFRDSVPLMFGGDTYRIKFWYSGPSLEAVLDRIPTAKVVKEETGRWLLSAEVIGKGAEMWLNSQGEMINIIDRK